LDEHGLEVKDNEKLEKKIMRDSKFTMVMFLIVISAFLLFIIKILIGGIK